MEVVAGVAGVAGVVGILGLVGQAVHGILKLKEFVHGVSTASETVKSFLRAIDSLESALTAISDLLRRTPEEWLVGAEARNTSRLASQIENCRADIDEWVKDVPMHHANSSKIIKSFFGKLRVASEESAYSVFHQKVARHLQGMQLSLDLLGWYACLFNCMRLRAEINLVPTIYIFSNRAASSLKRSKMLLRLRHRSTTDLPTDFSNSTTASLHI